LKLFINITSERSKSILISKLNQNATLICTVTSDHPLEHGSSITTFFLRRFWKGLLKRFGRTIFSECGLVPVAGETCIRIHSRIVLRGDGH
jgi:hypothetical protein